MIRATKLSKFYGGKRALGPVDFEISDGETVGFLGLNGAGKTTALRILACDLRPSSGTIEGGDVAGDTIDTLSHGFRQRVGVAQAIIHQPKFLILDEPTRGLDPVQIVEMRNLIHDLKQNHTVLISSHILTEISQTCDRLLVLGKGKLLGSGSEGDLAKHEGEIRQITVTIRAPSGDDPKAAITKVLAAIEGVSKVADPF